MLALLQLPNIVLVLMVGLEGTSPDVTLPWLPGQPLELQVIMWRVLLAPDNAYNLNICTVFLSLWNPKQLVKSLIKYH